MTLHSGSVNVDTVEVDPVFGTTGSFLTVTLTIGSGSGGGGGEGTVTSVNSVEPVDGDVTLTASDVGADASGAATTAVSTHAGLSDPHPGYLTPAEGNAAYDALGAASSAQSAAISAAATDATTKASAAQAAAEATAAGALSTHAADTTGVHGIADTADLIVEGDSRLTDSRTPTAHATSHQDGGTDELALDGSQVTSGTVADARIAATIARDSEVAATYAPLASPALTGNPTAPTPSAADNDTSIATTAYVQGELAAKAPLASPALTGNPTAPTQTAGNDSTRLATTAFVTAAVAAGGGSASYDHQDTLTAAADGRNTITLGNTPLTNSVLVWYGRFQMQPGIDYSLSGAVVTLNAGMYLGDVVTVFYQSTTSAHTNATLTSVTTGTYAAAVLADTPWGFWRDAELDSNTLLDLSGNARDMTLAGNYRLGRTGPKARAVRFGASTVTNYAAPAGSHTTSPATLEAWVYLFATPSQNTAICGCSVSPSNNTGDKSLWVTTAGKVNFYCFDGSARNLLSTNALTNNVWHHIVGTIGAAGQIIYVDKVQDGINAGVTSSYTGAAQQFYQRLASTGSAFVLGDAVRVAEAAFYTAQLSSTRVAAHYDAV